MALAAAVIMLLAIAGKIQVQTFREPRTMRAPACDTRSKAWTRIFDADFAAIFRFASLAHSTKHRADDAEPGKLCRTGVSPESPKTP